MAMSDAAGQDVSTPEPDDSRYGLELCGAKRTGRSSSGPGRCRHLAGWGTDHPGYGCCRLHGGATRTHRQSAIKKEAIERLGAYGTPIEIEPTTALLLEVHRTSGHV